MRFAAIAFGLVGGAAVIAACGGAGLPDLHPCNAPTAIVVPSGASGSDIEAAYRKAVREGIDTIVAESLSFSGRHPNRKLSNDSGFRNDYVGSEQRNVCQAASLIALNPPAGYLGTFHADLSGALHDYIDTMAFGHDAVKSRNVSDFQAWDGRENSAIDRLSIARDNIPTGP